MIYHPFDLQYKSPYGAVASGTQVTFTLRPRRTDGFSQGWLIAHLEQDNDRIVEVPLPWVSTDYQRDAFSGVLDTTGYVGLIWYSFRLEGLDGWTRNLGPYQLTVYDDTEPVPDWFGEGVCYQIFPDRFRRSTSAPAPEHPLFPPRFLHSRWTEEPWEGPAGQDEQGLPLYNRDFFGGNLAGITEALDHLSEMGVETLYLCPIFASAESHRYSTADYQIIDPLLGTEEDFRTLCVAAHSRGMRVILDGVFSHTGACSRYFSGMEDSPVPGATQSPDSPYYDWYQWEHWPDKYKSWWGITTLPTLDKGCPVCRRFLYGAEDSVVRRWLRAGADGWRLDVADELPDDFISQLRQAVREESPHAALLGEVWEDGTTKIAYGVRRKHLLGGHLDGLMNYPFRSALIAYLLGSDASAFQTAMETLREHYPPFAFHNAMNFLGTHDTPRILTVLALGPEAAYSAGDALLSPKQKKLALRRLKLGYLILFTFPGAPTVYYGDEAGLEGGRDPWNRRTYPWGRECVELLDWCRRLGQLRKSSAPLRRGTLVWGTCSGTVLVYARKLAEETITVAVNAGQIPAEAVLPNGRHQLLPPMTGYKLLEENSFFSPSDYNADGET